jgi:lysozyme
VADILFEEDFRTAKLDYEMLANRYAFSLNNTRRGVLINMLFNMGLPKVMKFKKMLAAISDSAWNRASAEMLNSKWARQVGKRSTYLAGLMRKGKV